MHASPETALCGSPTDDAPQPLPPGGNAATFKDRTVIASMIRVDHAGEFGAVRIYDGQIAVLGSRPLVAPALHLMRAQEREHLARFSEELADRTIRPTVLLPIWHAAGFAVGVATALLGEEAAMACTKAVEDTVVEHYDDQLADLGDREPRLAQMIARIRDEEQEHGDHATAAGASRAPGFPVLYHLIRFGCRAAIAISKRV